MFKLIGAVILIAVIVAIFQALAESGILTIIGIAIAVFIVARIGWGIYKKSKAEKTEPEPKHEPVEYKPTVETPKPVIDREPTPRATPASIAPQVSVRIASDVEEPEPLKNFKARVAGVSFDNEDGSSRQDILRCIYESGKKGEVTFEPYFYEGEQACYVYVDYECIGNIPKKDAERFVENIDRIKFANVKVEEFTGRDDFETKYRADIFVKYN